MSYSIWNGPPEGAERYGNLHVERRESVARDGRHIVGCSVWRGKAKKPYANYLFNSVEHREQWLVRQIEADRVATVAKAERAAARKTDTEKMRDSITVGTILYTSWGYDQTNVEFYQVVERPSRAVAIIRQIGCETVTDTGSMSSNVRPVRDAFCQNEEHIRKIINGQGVSFESYRHGWPWDHERDAKGVHCSWYA